MADLQLTPTAARVEFTTTERILGLVRDFEFPLTAVTSAEVEEDGLRAARGVRAPGFALPGRRKIGTWRGRKRRALVSVTAGQPAVRIALSGQRYDELVLGHPDAASWAERLTYADR